MYSYSTHFLDTVKGITTLRAFGTFDASLFLKSAFFKADAAIFYHLINDCL